MNTRPHNLINREIVAASGETMEAALEWKHRVDDIQARIDALDRNDLNYNNNCAQLQLDLRLLNNHQDRVKYWHEPRVLIVEFINRIRMDLDNYDKQHPTRQSAKANRLITDVRQKIRQIHDIQMRINDISKLHKCYFAICGLLWESLDHINKDEDQALEQTVLLILCQYRLNDVSARKEYKTLKERHSLETMTGNISEYQLKEDFKRSYLSLDSELKNARDPSVDKSNLIKQAHDVMQSIKDFQYDCFRGNNPFDYKFYMSILQCTQKLVANPQDQELKDQYHSLVNLCEDGKGSLKGKIAGAMIVLIGTVVALSGGATLVTGIAPLLPVCVISGSIISFAGLTLFSINRSHGPYTSINKFETTVKNQHDAVANERTPLLPQAHRLIIN